MNPEKKITIQGLPVLSDRVLKATDPIFGTIHTMEDYGRIAQKLRGPFAIIVEEDRCTTVVTDFGALFPVFFFRDDRACKYRVSPTLHYLRRYSSGRISARALFSNAYRNAYQGGIGMEPLYEDVRMALPARILRFTGLSIETLPWLDWNELLTETAITDQEAHDRFIEIGCSYLRPLLRSEGPAACLLSGGVDSALVAYLLKQACSDVICLTADYPYRRYSEWDPAVATARYLQLPQERVLVDRRDHRRALLAMNTTSSNTPASHNQLPSLHRLGVHAVEKNVRCLFTGDNAGPIFLEFDHFFWGFPRTTSGYLEGIGQLTPRQKLDRLVRFGPIDQAGREVLSCFGLSIEDCEQWIENARQEEIQFFEPRMKTYGMTPLMQIGSQVWAGVANQNCWLPAQIAVGGGMQLLSPFLDIEMIRFAISLPVELKYRDGVSKFILRDLLERRTGIKLPKRPSFNPSRVWSVKPDLADLFRIDGRVRSQLLSLMATNLATLGQRYDRLLQTTALGLWLRSHELGEVGPFIPSQDGAE